MLGDSAELTRARRRIDDAEVMLANYSDPLRIDWERPGKIGSLTANTGAFTTLLGTAVTGTTFNKLTLTAPAAGATLTIADGKTITVSNTLTFTGTDGSAVAFGAGGTVLYSGGASTVSALTITTGIAQGAGFKHIRQTTGSIGAGVTALVTITWAAAFADANYTVSAAVEDVTTDILSLAVVHVETKTAAAVAVRISNTSLGALTGTLHVIAVHD